MIEYSEPEKVTKVTKMTRFVKGLFSRKSSEPCAMYNYAEKELRLAGLFDEDSDCGGELGKAVLEMVEKFSQQGHSGFSAVETIDMANKLCRFEPLTPLIVDSI